MPDHPNGDSAPPRFTVIVSTYGRGALISPTLKSIQQQTCAEFEVIVVSDGPPADGLADAVAACDSRFTLLTVPTRVGSQAGPNNLGWSTANGEYIAYLGHDDVWHPDHLKNLLKVFVTHPDAHVAVAGCLWLGPPGLEDLLTWVTGLFPPGDRSTPRTHFFPPSSLAHRIDLPGGRANWPHPETTARAVDSQFLVNAFDSGAIAESTGVITAIKLTSGHRYLSHLSDDNSEQVRMLELMGAQSEFDSAVEAGVRAAVRRQQYMTTYHLEESRFAPGELLRRASVVRGVSAVPLTELSSRQWIAPDLDPTGWDWYAPELHEGQIVRWSGPNPRPRLLLPFTRVGPSTLRIHLTQAADPEMFANLQVRVNSALIPCVVEDRAAGGVVVVLTARLAPDRASVIELHTGPTVVNDGIAAGRRVGVCLTGIELEPSTE